MSASRDLDDRLSSAFHAEVDGVRFDAGSLDAIRRRGRAARRRRAALLAGAAVVFVAAAAAALTVPGGGRSGDVATDADRMPTPTPTTAPAADTVPPTRTAADALWPDPAAELFTDPVEATRSFLQAVLKVDDPPLSEFHAGEPGAGEVEVYRRGEDGRPLDRVASTVVLRQLDGEHWFVVAAESADVVIDAPAPLAEEGLPLTVAGQGHGHEGTIVAELRSRSVDAPPLAVEPTIGGAAGEPLAFAIDLWLDPGRAVAPAPTGAPAVLLVRDAPAVDADVPSFSARLVRVVVESPPAGSGDPVPTTAAEAPAYELPGQPLWPFRTQAEADAWRATADQGSAPWHADPAATAQSFTMNYLGFTEIDQIVDVDERATEAWVKVGYESEPGVLSVAAVVHLVRFGPSADAPWEVVGTTDDVLTLDTPRYGSPLSSPLIVGGTITGVDESVQVALRQISSPEPLGSYCCVPAGGERAWWETEVLWPEGATDPAVTVVAWSGGHVQDVEVFAITGLRT